MGVGMAAKKVLANANSIVEMKGPPTDIKTLVYVFEINWSANSVQHEEVDRSDGGKEAIDFPFLVLKNLCAATSISEKSSLNLNVVP